MNWKGVFGWDELKGDERKRALDMARQLTTLDENDAPDSDWSYGDVIDSMYDPPFAQSSPYTTCENADCDNNRLRVIAIQDEAVPMELIWPDKYVQTVWEMCSSCHCVKVTNQC